MAQLDVYRNPDPATAHDIPYVLDLQCDLLSHLATRVVAPLERAALVRPMQRLNPVFVVEGERVVMATADLAALHLSELGERVGSLAEHRDEIIAATDFLITGI